MTTAAPTKTLRFTVPGPPVGFYAYGARNIWKLPRAKRERTQAYHQYADKVRLMARAAGIQTPLEASKHLPVIINTTAYFATGVHCDPENVRKGISDALFYGCSGPGDKYCGGSFPPPLYDKENPRVEVEIEISIVPV